MATSSAPPSLLQQVAGAGGAAVITVSFIHPIDVVKTRLQVSGTGGAKDYRSLGIGGTVKVRKRWEEAWKILFEEERVERLNVIVDVYVTFFEVYKTRRSSNN